MGVLFLVGTASACASVRPPEIELVDLGVKRLSLSGGEIGLGLVLSNPNERQLVLHRVLYSVDVATANDASDWVQLGQGAHDGTVRLPPCQATRVDFSLPFTYRALGSAIGALLRRGEIDYRAHGTAFADGWLGQIEVPFTSSGRLRPFSGLESPAATAAPPGAAPASWPDVVRTSWSPSR